LDKWVKLHIRKKLLNMAVRFLNHLLPDPRPTYPQTQLLEQVYQKLFQTYRIETYCGRFDDVPRQTLEHLRDRHFLNILELSRKALIYLADTDRYYRQWLGLFLLLTHDVLNEYAECLTFEEACRQINGQWDYGLDERIFEHFFAGHRREAQEIVLCNYLHNLVTINLNRGEKRNEHPLSRS